MMDDAQPNPIQQLMALGKPADLPGEAWPDYPALGLGPEHIPDLLEIATDASLINIPEEENPRGWAPVHAWRALGQLHSVEAIEPLLGLFHGIRDNDWVIEEMPRVFAHIGPAAFAPLAAYLACASYPMYARLIAAAGLKQMTLLHPQVRGAAVSALAEQLRVFSRNSAGVNGVLIAQLVELGAHEQADLIQQAFAEGPVERFIAGDWRDVKKKLRTAAQDKILKTAGGEGTSAVKEPRTTPTYR